ncbi:ComEA family DNA-binding protein [Bisgaard Taxon 45]
MKLKSLLLSVFVFVSLFNVSHVWADSTSLTKAKTEQAVVQNTQSKQQAMLNEKVNINTASAAELQQKLLGIGAKKAEAIIQHREKHGPFTDIEQLRDIPGIGPSILEKNKAHLQL